MARVDAEIAETKEKANIPPPPSSNGQPQPVIDDKVCVTFAVNALNVVDYIESNNSVHIHVINCWIAICCVAKPCY